MGERAGIEKEGVHLERCAGIERVRRKKGDDAVARGASQPREAHMRRKFAFFGRTARALTLWIVLTSVIMFVIYRCDPQNQDQDSPS